MVMSFESFFVGVFKDLRDKDDGTEDKTTAACCLRTPIEPRKCCCGSRQESLNCHAVAALLGQGKG